MTKPTHDKDLQSEGNYDATHRYDQAAAEFAKSGKVDEAARAAAPDSPAQADDLKHAEGIGKSHSKGEAPALKPPRSPKK